MATKVNLTPQMFSDRPHTLLQSDAFSAVCFKYDTGVEAIEVSSDHVKYILLPYQGMQIWRLYIDGENMTMKSMFDVPEDTLNVFDESYGAFLIHCGLTAMGNPSDEDPHPMHGELPHAKYKDVSLELCTDEKGSYIELTGEYIFKLSIDTSYSFRPVLRLYENSKVLKMNCHIKNLRKGVFNYMYMAHINWMPVNGAKLIYSAPQDSTHIEVFEGDFGSVPSAARLSEYTAALMNNPTLADTLDLDKQCYDPELCVCVHYTPDENGWAHSMQHRPDGSACYVGFDTSFMPNGLRWFAWTGDEMSCGFALPTTGNHMGRAYAIEHGLRKTLNAGESVELKYCFGKLDPPEAAEMVKKISEIVQS